MMMKKLFLPAAVEKLPRVLTSYPLMDIYSAYTNIYCWVISSRQTGCYSELAGGHRPSMEHVHKSKAVYPDDAITSTPSSWCYCTTSVVCALR